MILRFLAAAACLLAYPALAQTDGKGDTGQTTQTEETEDLDEKMVDDRSLTSAENRDHSNFTPSYTIFSTGLILSKRGPALSYISSKKWSFELEYLEGDVGISFHNVDFATFKEELYLATARYYPGNVVNVFFGVGERRYSLKLGSDELDKLAPNAPNVDVLEVRNQIFQVGVGNRWQWEPGFTVGIDWLSLLLPIGKGTVDSAVADYIDDDETRGNTKKALGILRYIPTVTALKLHLGWTF